MLKQLLPEFTQQEEFIDLFLREAKLSATLDHANIIHDDRSGDRRWQKYFIVMEYLPGGDLRTLLRKAKRRGKRFTPKRRDLHLARGPVGAGVPRTLEARLRRQPAQADPSRRVAVERAAVVHGRRVKLTDFGIAEGGDPHVAVLQGEGEDRVHVARAGEERATRSPQRSLFDRGVHVRDPHRRAVVRARRAHDPRPTRSTRKPIPQVSRKVAGLSPDFDAIMQKALVDRSPDKRGSRPPARSFRRR